jgi:hypothetical protein
MDSESINVPIPPMAVVAGMVETFGYAVAVAGVGALWGSKAAVAAGGVALILIGRRLDVE